MHDLHIIWLFDLADEFNRFKDENGNFIVEITNDARGLLSLYNAAYLFTHGEPELEEAILFARQHLESMRNKLEYPLAQQVNRAFHLPLSRTLRRLEALIISQGTKESRHITHPFWSLPSWILSFCNVSTWRSSRLFLGIITIWQSVSWKEMRILI